MSLDFNLNNWFLIENFAENAWKFLIGFDDLFCLIV